MSKSTKELLQGGGKSWSTDTIGDYIHFRVKSAVTKQQTDDDGELKTFDNGDPMYMIVAEVVDLDDTEEDKSIWFSGGKFTALRNALSELPEDKQDIEPGDEGLLVYTGQHPAKKKSHTGAKIYEVRDYKKGTSKTKAALGKADAVTSPGHTSSPSPATYGPKPDGVPQQAWDVMPAKARAMLSPLPEDDDGRPDYIDAATWAKMPEEVKATMRVAQGPQRPEYIPATAWSMMSDEAKAAAAA